ncbi:MAG: SapC family protein [Gammaproteobacteria bacterium]
MAHLTALDNTAHRHLRIDPARVDAAGATLNMVPVVLSEFLKLVVQYPIALTKDKDTGRFVCVALFGFHDRENLFVENGQWNAVYVPLQVARQPFFLGNGLDDQFVVCIDPEHDSIQAEGTAIFDADGNATAYLENVRQVLAELVNGEAPTGQFVDTLARLKLLVPMQLEITFANEESTQVDGLYTIDEAHLEALSGDDIATLHAHGYLAPIYTMLASLGHIYAMIERRNQRTLRLAA